MLTGHAGHLLLQFGRPFEGNGGAALVSGRRVGTIGGQLHAFGHSGQSVLPVGQLARDPALAVGEVTELCTLPQRVIDILDRQFGPSRGMPGASRGVRHPQIGHQRSDRPTVGRDVVHYRRQYMFVGGETEKSCP
nr:hypothetical protein CPGR_00668 [Mycolicibacterium fortuitum subsp. fortuitum DSM 46621 = ATCC 6841 = JCM 6387]